MEKNNVKLDEIFKSFNRQELYITQIEKLIKKLKEN